MLRVLPYVIEIALLIYCLVDAIQSDDGSIRRLPKLWWLVIIVLVPIVGPIAWLMAGRPTQRTRARRSTRGNGVGRNRPPRIIAPEDDPDFIAKLHRSDPEKERLLEQWEADRQRREEQASAGAAGGTNPAKAADPAHPTDAADAADGAGGSPGTGPGPGHPDSPMDDPNPPVRPL
ncbi:MAG: PLDc_N domain-containing protein [Actinomycetales bacterium]|nr:PLDc_N domain-containing protein [Actinomycetales bacterium]